MFLRVSLANLTAPWRFPGSHALDEWLSWCPWRERGGVAVVRVAASDDAVRVGAAIEREVYGLDAGGSGVRVCTITLGAALPTAAAALCAAVEVTPGPARRATLQQLASVLGAVRFLFLLDLSRLDETLPVLDELEGLRDDLAKLPEPAALTAVAVVRSGGARGAFDFARGAPVDRPLDFTEPYRAWCGYLHTRIAWECAGEPSRATRWDEGVSQKVAQDDDDTLEATLNELAAHEWSARGDGARAPLLAWLRDPHAPSDERLEAEGLLWRPAPLAPLRPPAWIARALLDGADPNTRRRLRGAVTCAPLAESLVGACLDLEARHRARFCPPGEPRDETREAWARFASPNVRSEGSHYPRGCPAGPVDAWDLASFGEHITSSALPREVTATLHELRALRNAMAHGHYACWRSVAALRAVARALGAP
ncbi:MAG: hypothetical protein U0324_46865 [Polyangiales bacterium]